MPLILMFRSCPAFIIIIFFKDAIGTCIGMSSVQCSLHR